MKRNFILAALASAASMYGAVVNSSGGSWQTVTTPATVPGTTITSSVNNNATNSAFWNNTSTDSVSECANIGCYMVGSTFFDGAPGPVSAGLSNPVYLGNNNGTAVSDFSFSSLSVSDPTTLIAKIAGAANKNWVGWYDKDFLDAGGVFTAGNKNVSWGIIYTGADVAGATASFTPTANFGLWFLPNYALAATDAQVATALNAPGGSSVLSESSKNRTDVVGAQHFALFAKSASAAGTLPAEFWVGMEDGVALSSSDRDYQDTLIKMTLAAPEPGYYVLLSLGLAGLGLARRRLNKTV